MPTKTKTERSAERRGEERRKVQITPLPFPDRRTGERRGGEDRRGVTRTG